MSANTDHAENLILDWLFTTDVVTRPTEWHVALHTGDPGETGAANELSGNGYARQAATFSTASGGATANTGNLTFGPNTTTAWGVITHLSVWDASSAGNCLRKGALSAQKTVAVGDSITLNAGDLDLTED